MNCTVPLRLGLLALSLTGCGLVGVFLAQMHRSQQPDPFFRVRMGVIISLCVLYWSVRLGMC